VFGHTRPCRAGLEVVWWLLNCVVWFVRGVDRVLHGAAAGPPGCFLQAHSPIPPLRTTWGFSDHVRVICVVCCPQSTPRPALPVYSRPLQANAVQLPASCCNRSLTSTASQGPWTQTIIRTHYKPSHISPPQTKPSLVMKPLRHQRDPPTQNLLAAAGAQSPEPCDC
jgi:hypothetical protein